MFKRSIVFFPGFLGQPSDWDLLVRLLPAGFAKETQCLFMDYFSRKSQLSPLNTWNELNQYISKNSKSETIHFVGYSMGGRLALKLNQERVHPVKSMHLLSVHPGISKFHYPEKDVDGLVLERKNWDNIWADKFSRDSGFNSAFEEWQTLDVFKHDDLQLRKSENYNKDKLSLAFKRWSPAQIIIPKEQLDKHHWICGDKDIKYTELYKKMQKSLNGKFKYLSGIGHRTLFCPEHWCKDMVDGVLSSET